MHRFLDSIQIEMPAISNKKKSSHSTCTRTPGGAATKTFVHGTINRHHMVAVELFKKAPSTNVIRIAEMTKREEQKQKQQKKLPGHDPLWSNAKRTNCDCECWKWTVVACFIDHECMNDKRPRARTKSLICCFFLVMLCYAATELDQYSFFFFSVRSLLFIMRIQNAIHMIDPGGRKCIGMMVLHGEAMAVWWHWLHCNRKRLGPEWHATNKPMHDSEWGIIIAHQARPNWWFAASWRHPRHSISLACVHASREASNQFHRLHFALSVFGGCALVRPLIAHVYKHDDDQSMIACRACTALTTPHRQIQAFASKQNRVQLHRNQVVEFPCSIWHILSLANQQKWNDMTHCASHFTTMKYLNWNDEYDQQQQKMPWHSGPYREGARATRLEPDTRIETTLFCCCWFDEWGRRWSNGTLLFIMPKWTRFQTRPIGFQRTQVISTSHIIIRIRMDKMCSLFRPQSANWKR